MPPAPSNRPPPVNPFLYSQSTFLFRSFCSAQLGEQAVEQCVAQDVARVELPPRRVELVDREVRAQPAAHLLPWPGSGSGSGLGLGLGSGLGVGSGQG